MEKDSYIRCASYMNYPQMIERKYLNVVVIITPDHTHLHILLTALRTGYDIFREKLLTQNTALIRLLADAIMKDKRKLHTGSRKRSEYNNHFRDELKNILGETDRLT